MTIGWISYDELKIEFQDPVAGSTKSVSARKYEDTPSYRLGLNYRFDPQFELRAGYIHDNAAVPESRVEPSLPDGSRHIYNLGLGFKTGNFTIDGAYMLLLQDDREVKNSVDGFNGTYKSVANLYGINFGYSF